MFVWSSVMRLVACIFGLQWLAAEAYIYSGRPSHPDLPGHSDRSEVKGSSGYGCQTRDSEVVLPRNPKRAGEDDGTLWTGETVFDITRRPTRETNGSNGLDTVCSGVYRMPTVFWLGPSTQGSDGEDNKFGLGMITWETNDTDKADAWHVYRPCLGAAGRDRAFLLKGLAHYDNSTEPPDDTTLGLNLVAPPPGNEASAAPGPSGQLFFNGTYNGIKESKEYLGKAAVYLGELAFTEDLNCTSSAGSGGDFEFLSYGGGTIRPGTSVNGTLTNDTILLRLAGSWESKILEGEDTRTNVTVTNIIYTETEFAITFNGRYDLRNSSQRLVVNTTRANAMTFIAAGTRPYPPVVFSFVLSVVLFWSLYTNL
ncbi:conserved hypothetical protein [Histoplasma capsulatum var. duboisii H88]|uniref:Uncharacterized protein n=2 Tax=Ajellomyces capsulatus TaxID=5037 RepID=F0UAA7_AJEC8|nr:conserved hypothetical protein [Histoplasma capsulatum H143]EGC43669.1 conserved hypothetical protein [Histoplasma capsulatum var. duboisii H88]QSS49825.1 hypothetical protein I7I53_10295 [Histoplasma capsulatum var. duboisii H88]